MVSYKIETRKPYRDGGNWSDEYMGDPDLNRFSTLTEAEQAIAWFRLIGEDWASAEYRVVEVQS